MTRSSTLAAVLTLLAALVLSACSSAYVLPDPPPEDEWVDLSASPEEDEQVALRRFLDAKGAAVDVYSAMIDRDWDKVLDKMSQETVAFLEEGSDGKGAAAALESGVLVFSGQTIEFKPIDDFLITDLQKIEDTIDGQEEHETPRRKELYLLNAEGIARKVVFIQEADAWRFHSPFIGTKLIDTSAK